jgi:hypothetical protein
MQAVAPVFKEVLMRGIFGVSGAFMVVAAACTSHPLVRNVGRDAGVEEGGNATPTPLVPTIDNVAISTDAAPATDTVVTSAATPIRDTGPAPSDAYAPPCSAPNTILCDDFSNPTPPITRTVVPWPSMTAMTVAVSGGVATIQDPGAWSSSFIEWGSSVGFRDTSLEVDMTATTASRSLSYVIWGGPPTYISAGLQRDENELYVHVVVNNAVVARVSGSAKMAPDQTQHVALEVRANGQIRCMVDGVVVLTMSQDLSVFPSTLAPGVGANSYPSQHFTFDNLLVRKLTGS